MVGRQRFRKTYAFKNVRNVPPGHKLAVLDDAIRREITMNDVIGFILAEKYGKKYEPSGEKSIGADITGDQFRVRLPGSILECIWLESMDTKQTESSVVLSSIAAHFGLEFTPVKKGRRRVVA